MKKSILILVILFLSLASFAGSGDKNSKYYSNGNIKEKVTQHSQYFEVVKYYESGAIEEIEFFNLDKQKDGHWFRYYENGIIMGEATFKNNKKDGIWKAYDTEGKLSVCVKYKNNKKETFCMLTADKELVVK